MIAKAGIQIYLKSPGCKLLHSGIERDMYITNYEISYVNRIADSLRASSPIWASEASLAKTRERAAKPRGPLLARRVGGRGLEGGSLIKRLNIRKQPSFGRNLFCTLNHDRYTFLSTD